MAFGIKITLTHSGTTTTDVIIYPPYITVPLGGSIDLLFDDVISRSYETGSIRQAITDLTVTASFNVGTTFTDAVGGGGTLDLGPYSIYYDGEEGVVFFEGQSETTTNPKEMYIYASDFVGSAGPDPDNLNSKQTGGYIYLNAGYSSWGNGGRTRIYSGDGNDGDGGYLRLYAGDSYLNYENIEGGASYDGGYARLEGGYSSSGWGGDLELYAGDGGTYGGDVFIQSGYSNNVYPDYLFEGNNGQSGSIEIRVDNSGQDFARSGDITITIDTSPNGSDGGDIFINAGDSGFSATPPIEGGVASSQSGGGVFITAGDAWGYGIDGNHGGDIEIFAGSGTNDYGSGQSNGGHLSLSAGSTRAYGTGGFVELYAGLGRGRPTEVEGGSPVQGNGGYIEIYGGDCSNQDGIDETGDGGYIQLLAGDTQCVGDGGFVELKAGHATFNGEGGYAHVMGGNGVNNTGGELYLASGSTLVNNGSVANGGAVTIVSGAAFDRGAGGTIYITSGGGTSDTEDIGGGGNGRGGDIIITTGASTSNDNSNPEFSRGGDLNIVLGSGGTGGGRGGRISVSSFGTGIVTSNSGVLSASNNSTGQGSVAIANGANNAAFTVTIDVVPAVGYMFMFTCQAGHTAVSVQSSYFYIDDATGKPVVKGTASNSDVDIRNIYINWMLVPFPIG